MGIKIENAEVRSELVYNKIHLNELEILQNMPIHDPKQPYYELRLVYRLYAVDPDTKKRYYGEQKILKITDYISKAMSELQNGDPRLIQAMGAIEQALADILNDNSKYGATEVY
jgi:hypothetical protein